MLKHERYTARLQLEHKFNRAKRLGPWYAIRRINLIGKERLCGRIIYEELESTSMYSHSMLTMRSVAVPHVLTLLHLKR